MKKKLKSKWSLKAPLYIRTNDKRYSHQLKQLRTDGFSDSETWGLDSVIAEFILPRLIRFQELNNGFPGGVDDMTFEKWSEIIEKMIFAFDWSLNHESEKYDYLTKSERLSNWETYKEGMDLFAKWFKDLWW